MLYHYKKISFVIYKNVKRGNIYFGDNYACALVSGYKETRNS